VSKEPHCRGNSIVTGSSVFRNLAEDAKTGKAASRINVAFQVNRPSDKLHLVVFAQQLLSQLSFLTSSLSPCCA
jgi:hypothetical protein